jgi:hypothetical protein
MEFFCYGVSAGGIFVHHADQANGLAVFCELAVDAGVVLAKSADTYHSDRQWPCVRQDWFSLWTRKVLQNTSIPAILTGTKVG